MMDRDKEPEVYAGAREYTWCRVVAGQVHREPESVSRSIWDKVRRFCAPRFAETLRVAARTGERAALSLRPFCRRAFANCNSDIARCAALLEREKRARSSPLRITILRSSAYVCKFVTERWNEMAGRIPACWRDAASEFRNCKFRGHLRNSLCVLYRCV